MSDRWKVWSETSRADTGERVVSRRLRMLRRWMVVLLIVEMVVLRFVRGAWGSARSTMLVETEEGQIKWSE